MQEVFRVHRAGKMLAPNIDGAHLIHAYSLRKRLLRLEDRPRLHNLVLIGQPPLL